MSGTISFNPFTTTFPPSPFLADTQGYVTGFAQDDPTTRNWLAGGVLASSETVVMWGGVPISEEINQLTTGSEALGPTVKRATTQGNTTGWSVFNQAGSMVITPGNSAPATSVYGYVSFYRNGTNARIAVSCDSALVALLTAGELIYSPALYWDVTNYRITLTTTGGNWALPTTVKLLSVQTNSKITTYASSAVSWSTGDAAIILI